jgi:hypothetical protein
MKNRLFPILIAISAISISLSAAYYSVTGLSMLFAGASLAVAIMASSLEISKLVIASLLYQYWGNLNKLLRFYLTTAVIILILITSAGIYGFLSNSYQTVATQSEIVDKHVSFLESKKNLYENTRNNILNEKQAIQELKNTLSKNSTIQYTDTNQNKIIRTNRSVIKNIEIASKSDETLSLKLDAINDSIFVLETQILETQINDKSTSELGPLKYISGLTGQPMDKIINWFLFVIIFVFDPLAISLVIAANFAFAQIKSKNKQRELISQIMAEDENNNLYETNDKELETASLVDFEEWEEENEPNEALQQAAKTYRQKNNLDLDVNGDGIIDENEFREGFNKLDLDGNGIIDENESNAADIDHQQSQKFNQISSALKELENINKTTLYDFQWKKDKAEQEINNLKNILLKDINKDDENTIRYF